MCILVCEWALGTGGVAAAGPDPIALCHKLAGTGFIGISSGQQHPSSLSAQGGGRAEGQSGVIYQGKSLPTAAVKTPYKCDRCGRGCDEYIRCNSCQTSIQMQQM